MSVALLEVASKALGAMVDRVVFLGGATVGLWFTDPAARAPRVTYDVDVVAEVVTLLAYESFQADLRQRGFAEDIDSGVICRWTNKEVGLVLDVVPRAQRLAGFGGRWLASAADAAITYRLPSGVSIRVVPPAWLLVTKIEAFNDRGGSDCLSSRDFEDIVLLVDARHELAEDLAELPDDVRNHVRQTLARMLSLPSFDYGLEGALLGADARSRASTLTLPRIRALAAPDPQ